MKKSFEKNNTSDIDSRKKGFWSIAIKFLVVLIPVAFLYAANPFVPKFYGDPGSPAAPDVPNPEGRGHGSGGFKGYRETEKPVIIDPNAIGAAYYDVNGNLLQNVKLGRQKQGLAASVLFANSTPAGWTEAYPFSMTVNGVNDYTLKDGLLKIHIPGPVQKAGRTFAVLALDKDGKVHLYQDADRDANVFSAKLDVEGYAFDLIFTD